ncbi:hypothetical protein GQX74_014048 [Glossina fuscipes]|nr:hypothetical protein GQX74_014048 [Glossina fuscipes]
MKISPKVRARLRKIVGKCVNKIQMLNAPGECVGDIEFIEGCLRTQTLTTTGCKYYTKKKDEDKVYSHATGNAMRFIRNRNADIMLPGSGESCIDPLSIAGFCRIRALSTAFNEIPSQTSRPFDKNRDGFVMGEGAAILLLKELEHALQRKANILGEILGYELVTPIISLKKDGHIAKDDVTYVNAHATSTPAGDRFEAQTIHKVFGDHVNKLRVSSTKGHHGHLLGSSGNLDFNKSSRRSQNTTFVKYRRIRNITQY